MEYDENNVPDDVATLQALVISLSQMTVALTAEVRRLTTLLEKLFGNSSEKLSKEKPTLEVATLRKNRTKNGGGGRRSSSK